MAATSLPPGTPSPLERRFRFSERGTTLRTEALGGLATFLTMATSCSSTRRSCRRRRCRSPAVAVATALAAAICTLAMGLITNLPFALAPGLGINAVVAFDIVLGRRLPWPVGDGVRRDRGRHRARARPRRPARGDHAARSRLRSSSRSASASACSSRSSGCARAASSSTTRRPASALGDLTAGPPLIALAGICGGGRADRARRPRRRSSSGSSSRPCSA